MGAREAFGSVFDPNGLISNESNPKQSSGNCLLFTAEALICLREAEALPYDLAKKITTDVFKNEISPGLFARTPRGQPFSFDQESQDDYIGLGVISRFYGKSLAQRILTFGSTHYYIPWSNYPKIKFAYYYPTAEIQSDRDFNAWLGRFPALIAHLHWASGRKPNLFYRFGWFFSVAFCSTSQDGWILSSLLCYQVSDMGWIEQTGAFIRRWRFKRSPYSGQLKLVFRNYFGWDHPISLWCWE